MKLRKLQENDEAVKIKMYEELYRVLDNKVVIVFSMDKGRADYPMVSSMIENWHAITTVGSNTWLKTTESIVGKQPPIAVTGGEKTKMAEKKQRGPMAEKKQRVEVEKKEVEQKEILLRRLLSDSELAHRFLKKIIVFDKNHHHHHYHHHHHHFMTDTQFYDLFWSLFAKRYLYLDDGDSNRNVNSNNDSNDVVNSNNANSNNDSNDSNDELISKLERLRLKSDGISFGASMRLNHELLGKVLKMYLKMT